MITRTKINEWLVEPDIEGAREYARLSIIAEFEGINIDGQGIITWKQLKTKMKTMREIKRDIESCI
jgi:hypothetical protein